MVLHIDFRFESPDDGDTIICENSKLKVTITDDKMLMETLATGFTMEMEKGDEGPFKSLREELISDFYQMRHYKAIAKRSRHKKSCTCRDCNPDGFMSRMHRRLREIERKELT